MTQAEQIVLIAVMHRKSDLLRSFQAETARLLRTGLITRSGGNYAATPAGYAAFHGLASSPARLVAAND